MHFTNIMPIFNKTLTTGRYILRYSVPLYVTSFYKLIFYEKAFIIEERRDLLKYIFNFIYIFKEQR